MSVKRKQNHEFSEEKYIQKKLNKLNKRTREEKLLDLDVKQNNINNTDYGSLYEETNLYRSNDI